MKTHQIDKEQQRLLFLQYSEDESHFVIKRLSYHKKHKINSLTRLKALIKYYVNNELDNHKFTIY